MCAVHLRSYNYIPCLFKICDIMNQITKNKLQTDIDLLRIKDLFIIRRALG